MHLALCVVSARDWKPHFGVSLVHLVAELPRLKGTVKAFAFLPRISCSLLPKARRMILHDAVEAGCSHALCIDDDMQFPPDAVTSMVSRGKPFVAANYQGKTGENTAIALDQESRVSSKGKTGIEEVDRVGFGMVLLDLSVVQQIPQPLFTVPWVSEAQAEIGEDYWFCLQWRKTGNGIWVDHDVSNQIKHIADVGLETR